MDTDPLRPSGPRPAVLSPSELSLVDLPGCLPPDMLPTFHAEIRAVCRKVADEGVAHLQDLDDVIRRWWGVAWPCQDREAAEEAAAEEIAAYYGGVAPLPDGVVPVSEADIAAADRMTW